ncbi:hypothetical protein AAULR_08895, partial [Lacticaseibacillus rhamnosus MTCC 5462]
DNYVRSSSCDFKDVDVEFHGKTVQSMPLTM